MGLVIAVVSGQLPEAYVDLALGEQGGVEVCVAPAGNLVLSECFFGDKAFPRCAGSGAVIEALLQAFKDEMAGSQLQAEFDTFRHELYGTIAPRLRGNLKELNSEAAERNLLAQ